jgi:hypothetical protein
MLSKQSQDMIQTVFKKLNKASIKHLPINSHDLNDEKQLKLSTRIELSQAFFTDVLKNNPQINHDFDRFTLQGACTKITGYGGADALVSLWLVYFFKQLVLWQQKLTGSGAKPWPCFVAVVNQADSPMILLGDKAFTFQVNTSIDLDLLGDGVWVVDPLHYPNNIKVLDEYQVAQPTQMQAQVLFCPEMQTWLSKESIDQTNKTLSVVANAYPAWIKAQLNQNEQNSKTPVIIEPDEYADEQSIANELVEELFLSVDQHSGDNMAADPTKLTKLKKPLSQIKTTRTSLFERLIERLRKLK